MNVESNILRIASGTQFNVHYRLTYSVKRGTKGSDQITTGF